MTIKHLVISGGGPMGLRYLGVLQTLHNKNFWNIDDIESIYSTSIGTFIATFFCLKYDYETLNTYIFDRPWYESIKLTPKQLFESYYNKGLFDRKIIEIVFNPLFKAKDLNINITLQDFYNYSNIDLHIFSFDVNSFKTVEFSHSTHPNIELIDAITMSSSLPGLFVPYLRDGCCYIDGGVLCNYPINECIRDHPNEEECLGVNVCYVPSNEKSTMNSIIDENSSLLDYIISISVNSMYYIRNSIKTHDIPNFVNCDINFNPLSIELIISILKEKSVREEWFKQGEIDANIFLENIK